MGVQKKRGTRVMPGDGGKLYDIHERTCLNSFRLDLRQQQRKIGVGDSRSRKTLEGASLVTSPGAGHSDTEGTDGKGRCSGSKSEWYCVS